MKKILGSILMCCILMYGLRIPIYAQSSENEENTVQRVYEYISDTREKKDGSIKDYIKINGSKFKLKEIKYKSKPLEIENKVRVDNKEKYQKTISKTINGKRYNFVANNIAWKEQKKDLELTENVEYKDKSSIPHSMQKGEYILTLSGIDRKIKNETFTAPAKFISYSESPTEYFFNGSLVQVTQKPIWDGYRQAIKNYLGINGNTYVIHDGVFTSRNMLVDEATNRYERIAIYTGTKSVPYFLATYRYEGEDKENTEYVGKATYRADGYYMTTANATYEKENTIIAFIKKYGLGIGIIVIALATIIYLFGKRKKKEEPIFSEK